MNDFLSALRRLSAHPSRTLAWVRLNAVNAFSHGASPTAVAEFRRRIESCWPRLLTECNAAVLADARTVAEFAGARVPPEEAMTQDSGDRRESDDWLVFEEVTEMTPEKMEGLHRWLSESKGKAEVLFGCPVIVTERDRPLSPMDLGTMRNYIRTTAVDLAAEDARDCCIHCVLCSEQSRKVRRFLRGPQPGFFDAVHRLAPARPLESLRPTRTGRTIMGGGRKVEEAPVEVPVVKVVPGPAKVPEAVKVPTAPVPAKPLLAAKPPAVTPGAPKPAVPAAPLRSRRGHRSPQCPRHPLSPSPSRR